MTLEMLLADVSHRYLKGDGTVEIASIAYDSREVSGGTLFICIPGEHYDGHDFIGQAIQAGAAAILAEREPDKAALTVLHGAKAGDAQAGTTLHDAKPPERQAQTLRRAGMPDAQSYPANMPEITYVIVPDVRESFGRLCAAWFHHPADKMTIIGLTGTKGKTTTSLMVRAILEEAGYKTGVIGTMGAFIGNERLEYRKTTPTTPDPYELHGLFAQMKKRGCTHVVMEVSSQALKMKRTAGVRFACAAFLNLSPDHIGPGEHKDFREYLECKRRLFLQADLAVASTDDGYWREVVQDAADVLTVSTGLKEPEYKVSDSGEADPGTTLSPKLTSKASDSVWMHHGAPPEGTSTRKPESFKADLMATRIRSLWEDGMPGVAFNMTGCMNGRVVLSMPGKHNVQNALVSAATAYRLGISESHITAALARVSVRGRTQVLRQVSHFSTFIIDYAHNALSMESLLMCLREYRPKRLICLFGCGGNRPKQRRYDMGYIAGKYADLSVITMDNPRFEEVDAINADIIRGLKAAGGAYMVINDRRRAIEYLIDHAEADDIVALIGKGHETCQEVRGVRYPFSEEKIINDYIETK